MSAHEKPLILHVGYPKTATTTFQQHVFPHHPEIEYLGKFIPSFQYVEDHLYGLMSEIIHCNTITFRGTSDVRVLVRKLCSTTSRNCVLLSSESFIHPSVIDIGVVADRLYSAFYPCKILITIREQISAILSFYWMHGCYAQYLTIGSKKSDEHINYPLSFLEWLRLQKSSPDRNYLNTLDYNTIVKYYIEKFGIDNVRVLLYEIFRSDPNSYADDLGDFLGVDVQVLRDLMANNHELKASGRDEPWSAGHSNILSAMPLQRKLTDFFSNWFEKPTDEFSNIYVDQEIALLRDKYRAGNMELVKHLSLPLDQYGYSV